MLGAGELDVRVEPGDVDEARAAPVGGSGDRAEQVLLAWPPADADDLSGLDVGADLDGQAGKTFDMRGGGRDGRIVSWGR